MTTELTRDEQRKIAVEAYTTLEYTLADWRVHDLGSNYIVAVGLWRSTESTLITGVVAHVYQGAVRVARAHTLTGVSQSAGSTDWSVANADGNPNIVGRFGTREEAEQFAFGENPTRWRNLDLAQ